MRHYQAAVHRISDGVDRFFKRTFTRLDINGPAVDMDRLRSSRLLVPCTHRSQTDYFVAGHVLFNMGIPNMRFAAGENLTSLPVIGKRFRQMGAFSVRRGKTLGRGYVRGLCEQVIAMLSDGDVIIVFPEGGRSYGGEMMTIRGGIVGAGVISQLRDSSHEVLYLPMSISYERLPELTYFDMLLKGKQMARPDQSICRRALGSLLYFGADAVAFTKLLNAHRFGIKYGVVHVDYGQPAPVTDIVDLKNDITHGARDDFSACRTAFQKLSSTLFDAFVRLYRILPSHVVSRVLLDSSPMTLGQAESRCEQQVRRLQDAGRNVRSVIDYSGEELVVRGVRQLAAMRGAKICRGAVHVTNPFVVRYHAVACTQAPGPAPEPTLRVKEIES